MKNIKSNLLYFFFSFIFSSLLILISLDSEVWVLFWNFLNIPAISEPFSDLKSIAHTLASQLDGHNVYLNNPYDVSHGVFLYPSIWLKLFNFFHLNDNFFFIIFILIISFIYFFVIFKLFSNNDNYCKLFLSLFFLSTSNFILLERFNIEIIIFLFIYFSLNSKNLIFRFLFYSFGLIAKVFPIFSIFIFFDNKKFFILVLLISLAYFYFIKEELYFMNLNIIEYPRIFAYGSGSISKIIYYFSKQKSLFFITENYEILKSSVVLFFTLIFILIFLKNLFNNNKIDYSKKFTLDEVYFLSGGGIYIGTFIFASNVDYRLIFLIFTFIYYSKNSNSYFKYFCIVMYTIVFNSFIFDSNYSFSINYFIKGFFIYSLKFIIFIILSNTFTKIIIRKIGTLKQIFFILKQKKFFKLN